MMIWQWGNIYELENGLLQRVNWLLLEIHPKTKMDLLLYFHPGLYKYIGFSSLAIYLAVGDRYFLSK